MALFVPVVSQVGLQLLLQPAASGVIANGACTAFGVAYPAYATFKGLESRESPAEVQKVLAHWITYWAIFGALSALESLTTKRPPGYYHVKLAFLLWLQSARYQGAQRLYINHARPFLIKHEATTDQWVAALHNLAARPEVDWLAGYATQFAKGVPGLEWFVRPAPDGIGDKRTSRFPFW